MDSEILYVPRDKNHEANDLTQHSSKYKELEVKEHEYKWFDVVAQDVSAGD